MLAPVGPQAHPAASFHIQRPHSHVTVRLEDWPQREHDRMLLVDVSVLLCQLTSLYMLSRLAGAFRCFLADISTASSSRVSVLYKCVILCMLVDCSWPEHANVFVGDCSN